MIIKDQTCVIIIVIIIIKSSQFSNYTNCTRFKLNLMFLQMSVVHVEMDIREPGMK